MISDLSGRVVHPVELHGVFRINGDRAPEISGNLISDWCSTTGIIATSIVGVDPSGHARAESLIGKVQGTVQEC